MIANRCAVGLAIVAMLTVVWEAAPALARSAKACTAVSKAEFAACIAEAKTDKGLALARCANRADPMAVKSCKAQAASEAADEKASCMDERDFRTTVCAKLGEMPFAPASDPARLVAANDD